MSTEFFLVTLRWLAPAIAATIVAHLALYLRSRTGNHVVVYRASERSRLRSSDLSLVKLLSGSKDRDPDTLVLNELRIVNNSNVPIDDLRLSVKLSAPKGPLEFWASDLADPLGRMKCEKGENSLNLTRDFINSRSSFNEESIRLRILSNTKLNFSVKGGGRNWLAKFEDRSLPEKHAALIWLCAVLAIVLSVVVFALSSSTYFQGSAILASLNVLAIAFDTAIVVVLAWIIRRNRNSREQ
jgi:hypothetical protein